MSNLGLNEHHDALVLNYLRFAKFQRHQCLKAIRVSFQDAKETRLTDDTYTVDEIEEILEDVSNVTEIDIEAELMAAAHTNVLLLQQVFKQAQKWHLDLDADLAELENKELLDKVKNWEDSELSNQGVEDKPILAKKKLAPLNEGGPMQLLKAQIDTLGEENSSLRRKVKDLESKALNVLDEKKSLEEQMIKSKKADHVKEATIDEDKVDAKEIEELSKAFRDVKAQMATELELSSKNQKELEGDLTSTKHKLLDIQHQLNMAEKELEKKFSQTGAYKNLKKMLLTKNEQIKELRTKLRKYEDLGEEEE